MKGAYSRRSINLDANLLLNLVLQTAKLMTWSFSDQVHQ